MILASSSPVSWLLALAAAVAYAVPAAASSRLGGAAARNALLLAWLLHGALLVWGWWGEAPRFGFAPALSMTAWLVLTVYAVERQLFPQIRIVPRSNPIPVFEDDDRDKLGRKTEIGTRLFFI